MTAFDPTPYLKLCGLSGEQARALGIDTWPKLTQWLDENEDVRSPTMSGRRSIIPPAMSLSWKAHILPTLTGVQPVMRAAGKAAGWEKQVEYRRRVALALTLVTTVVIVLLSDYMLSAQHMPRLTTNLYLAIYGLMTFFLVSNFYKLILGAWHTLRGHDKNPWHPSKTATDPRPSVKTAILFPVYHEEVPRVAAGVAATWESIRRNYPEFAHHFDFFLLSDSRKTEYWIAEQAAIHRLKAEFPDGRFCYRRRASNLNAKIGNISDFCRRWGDKYEYLLVMDADSVMDGEAIISLLRMMEGNDRLGILQTNPKPILRKSLFGRMQQFAARLYGPVFSYSLQAMYMGHASYIGHNAIIRTRPFIEHCILPELPGKPPFGGKPLSHDIVESALMARAGYEVWFLPEIAGSYEEIPANIVGFLVRERRWMQGNLQHLQLLFIGGLRASHRETFLNGCMGYVSAPLWACFLIVSAYGMVHFFGAWDLSLHDLRVLELPASMLLGSSMVFLFLPRVIAIAVHLDQRKAQQFGGKDKLLLSTLLETIFCLFFSPIIMIFVTRFVWLWVKRRSVFWGIQQRDDTVLPWSECVRQFGWVSVLGVLCWIVMGYQVNDVNTTETVLLWTFSGGWVDPNDMLLWFFPILSGLACSIPIVRLTSQTFSGVTAKRLFTVPEELDQPEVVRCTVAWEKRFRAILPALQDPKEAFSFAVFDRGFYLNHRPETRHRAHIAAVLLPKIITPQPLTARELLLALSERSCFDALHGQPIEVIPEAFLGRSDALF